MKGTSYAVITALLVAATAASWAQQPAAGGPRDRRPGVGFPPQMGGPQTPPRGGPGGGFPPQMGEPGMPPRGGPGGGDPMGANFFPPELVMQHQGTLALSAEQKAAIREAMQKTMARFTELQWEQSAEQETMAGLMKAERLDEAKTLAQFDKLVNIENEIKRMHLGLMIKIKNTLTAEQQVELRKLKQAMSPAPAGAGQRGQPGPAQQRRARSPGAGGPAEPPGPPPER